MMFDDYIAVQEGWVLSNDANDRVEVQRIDDPASDDSLHYDEPLFDSDEAALAFVTKLAEMGSYYHQQALSFIGASMKELL